MKKVKTVRIEMESVDSKIGAFNIYAKSINKSPRKLLGEVLDQFITKRLHEVTNSLNDYYGFEEGE